MNYPLYDFENLHDSAFREEAKKRVAKIIDDNSFVEGPFNDKFESEFAKIQGAPHCLLVANGTDALEVSLRAQGVNAGDKVGIAGITFYATAEAVVNVGAKPVFIDAQKETGLMCPESFERMAQKHDLKSVIPVHIYGLPCDMKAINQIAEKYNVAIIEDAAQACGSFFEDGTPVGSNPMALTTFSFYPTKNLSAAGDAGAILTHNDKDVDLIKAIRNHGRGMTGVVGRNSRCDHMQAAILHLKLEKIEQYNKARKAVAKNYYEHLSNKFKLVPDKYIDLSSWHLFPVHFDDPSKRENLQSKLGEAGIASAPYYLKSMAMEEALGEFEGEREVADSLAGNVLCLPINPFLNADDVKNICQEVLKHT